MQDEILSLVEELSKKLPKFEDGRIDYSNSSIAPVLNIFIEYKNRFLILKRSDKVDNYKNKWNSITGFIDEVKPIKEKVLEEIDEEIGVEEDKIHSLKLGSFYKLKDKNIGKTWIIQPALVNLKEKVEIELDWEHTEFKWIKRESLKNYNTVSGLCKVLDSLKV